MYKENSNQENGVTKSSVEIAVANHTNREPIEWPPHIVRIVEEYKYEGVMLDGLCAYTPPDLETLGKKLPMNNGSAVDFLRGDVAYYFSIGSQIPSKSSAEIFQNDLYAKKPAILVESIGPLILAASALCLINKSRELSRRSFLKLTAEAAVGAAGLLMAARVGSGAKLISNSDGRIDSLEARIYEKTMPLVISQDWWLNGRTAVLVEKATDYANKESKHQLLITYGVTANFF